MANDDQDKRLVTNVIRKIAITKQHRDIEHRMREHACSIGYTIELRRELALRKEPDVYQARAADNGDYLYVGDAKFSQGATDQTSVEQLRGYFEAFGHLLGTKRLTGASEQRINGGYLAVGSPTEQTAREWKAVLDRIANEVGLRAVGGTAPSFRLDRLPDGAETGCEVWIAWW